MTDFRKNSSVCHAWFVCLKSLKKTIYLLGQYRILPALFDKRLDVVNDRLNTFIAFNLNLLETLDYNIAKIPESSLVAIFKELFHIEKVNQSDVNFVKVRHEFVQCYILKTLYKYRLLPRVCRFRQSKE